MPIPSSGTGSIAKRWRELHGEHSWSGLLDPLDIDLRKSLISYGEVVQAASDGFNNEKRSPHAGDCIYDLSALLTSTGVANARHYKVTKFVYATAAELCLFDAFRESSFMGYVAVATDEGVAALGRRNIIVAWRGSVTRPEWIKDSQIMLVPAEQVLGSAAGEHPLALVHRGFLSLYMTSNADSKFNKTSARDQVLEEVRSLIELYKDEETSITITGHSLGAALSVLNAVDIVSNGLNTPAGSSKPPCPVTAILFACPFVVGNHSFKWAFESFHNLRALHVKNKMDPIANPPIDPIIYTQVGVPLPIDTTLSPYLKDPECTAHNLQCYLHGVAGEQGSAGGFKLEVDRDVALVNKDADALKDEHPVPASWWVVQNKCMVKNAQGKWELKDFKRI